MRSNRREAIRRGLCAWLAAGAASGAPAQPAAAGYRLPPPPAAVTPADVVVRSVRFEGHTKFSDAELQAIAAPFLNRPLRTLEIEELRLAVTRAYVGRGYVNSGAELPDAALAGGQLTLRIVEGRVTALRASGLQGLNERYLAARLIDPDEPLQQERLQERFSLLLADPLFERLNARLVPGERPGQSVLDVEVTRARPWSLALVVHNQLAPAIGSRSAGIEAGLRNLTSWGDQLAAIVSGTGDSGDSINGDASWALPLAGSRTLLTLRVARSRSSVIEEPLAGLDIDSVVTAREATLAYPLLDEARRRFALGIAGSRRSNTTTLAGEPFSFVSGEDTGTTRLHSTRLFAEATLREERSVLAGQLSWVRGRNNIVVPAQGPALPRVPAAQYSLWQLQVQGSWTLDAAGRQLLLRGQLQHSPDALVPLEQMAIGGRRTVRGWRENQLVRDNGYAISAELLWPLFRDDERRLAVTLVPFVDAGAAWNRGEARRNLASAGLGVQGGWAGFELELFAAKRLEQRLSASRGNLQDHGIHFLLRYRPSF